MTAPHSEPAALTGAAGASVVFHHRNLKQKAFCNGIASAMKWKITKVLATTAGNKTTFILSTVL